MYAALSKHTSITKLSVPFQMKGVVNVWVFQPVDAVYVLGP